MSQFPFRAVISDLDGTLLNSEHMVGDLTAKTLRELESKGVDIILASGRSYADMSKLLNKIGVKKASIVSSNGARIYDINGNLLYSNSLNEDIAFQLMNLEHDTKTTFVNSYQDDGWFASVDVPDMLDYHQDSNYSYSVVDFKNHHARGVEKIFYISKEGYQLNPIEKAITERFGDRVSLTYSIVNCLEIMSAGVSKGSALAQLLADRDYSLDDCIAFGDGLNDKEMLLSVGKGCMMANADPRLSSQLSQMETIGYNKDEAVANYLRKIFNLD